MSKPRPISDRLRSLARREGQRISHADALLAELAAALIEDATASIEKARRAEMEAMRDACSYGATLSVARDRLRQVLEMMEQA
jgi:hypothetical protein